MTWLPPHLHDAAVPGVHALGDIIGVQVGERAVDPLRQAAAELRAHLPHIAVRLKRRDLGA
jgi:hypothetical protein